MKRKKQLQIGSIYALLILLSFIWLFYLGYPDEFSR